MSGHSHWATIKFKKAAVDAKRGKLWSKLARQIIVAARAGGPDPSANLTLRYAIDKAKAANMPKDTIEKAIKRGTGQLEGITYEQVLYEGYSPGAVAVMVEALTDNRNRTASEIRKIFETRGGSLGSAGCVSWLFSKKGYITVSAESVDETRLLEIALAAGADDMKNTGERFELTCAPAAFEDLKNALAAENIATQLAEVSMVPQSTVSINNPETARKILALMETIEDHDDVQNVYSNFDIPDEILRRLE
jgi:YebC/PmpR family DNA-binding regulatory protein